MEINWIQKIGNFGLTLAIVTVYGLLMGAFIERIIAKVQGRVGIPYVQPFINILQTLTRRTAISHGVMFYLGPVFRIAGGIGTLAFVPVIYGSETFSNFSFAGDLMLVIYFMFFGQLGMALGAGESGHPYAAIGIARERELGTLEQLTVTPVRRFELIIAKTIPAVLLSYITFMLMMQVAIHAFGVPMRGSWPLLLGSASIFLFVELSIGLMISAVSATQLQALLGAFMWVMVEFLFSGYGVPVENMPLILQRIAHIFPIYHYMIIFRAVLLKGVGLETIWPQILAGLAIGAVVIPTAVWFLGRHKWE
jgi:ABC-type multidrug transport system permease subunit